MIPIRKTHVGAGMRGCRGSDGHIISEVPLREGGQTPEGLVTPERAMSLIRLKRWCPEEDSNFHDLAATGT
ncbi:MAG: hypothetical protein ABF854_17875, partial [Gluconacetobacter sp.]